MVFLAASMFYLFTTGEHVFWLDSAQFVAVARGAGIAHPPGSPLYLILANLATFLPFGGVAFRVNLLNAALGGACAWMMFRIACRLVRPWIGGWIAGLGAAAVSLAFAVSPAIWFQSVRAEVYALNALLCLAMVDAVLAWADERTEGGGRQRKHLWLAALWLGLGLANHHFLTILAAAGCGVYLAVSVAKTWMTDALRHVIAPALGWAAAGVVTYAYLPVRAVHGWRMWGDPTTVDGFLGILSARSFHLSVTDMPVAPLSDALVAIFSKWVDLLSWPLAVVGVAGLIAFLFLDVRKASLLLALVLAGAVSKAIMYLDVENPDDHAYFLTGLQALAIASVGAPALALAKLNGRARTICSATAAAAVLAASGAGGYLLYTAGAPNCILSGFTGPDTLNRHLHERVAPDAVFMPSYYAMFFNHMYYRGVERRRPDLAMAHQSFHARFDGGKGYVADVVARHPDLAPVFEELLGSGRFPLASLLAVAAQRPVLLENDTTEVLDGGKEFRALSLGPGGLTVPVRHLSFAGPGLELRPMRLDWATQFERQRRFWTALYRDLEGTPLHPELVKHLVWNHYRNALYFINDRNWNAALLEVRMARRLEPDSIRLSDMESSLSSR